MRRLVALAALALGFTEQGVVRWVLFGVFAVIVAGDLAWQERDRRAGPQ